MPPSNDYPIQNTTAGRVFCYDKILRKIEHGERLSKEDAMRLLDCDNLSLLAELADVKRRQINGKKVYFNQNFHIEPSNVCVHRCRFCSYRRCSEDEEGAWTLSMEQMRLFALEKIHPQITEVHITGSVHPHRDIHFYADLIKALRATLASQVSIKAFSAIEIDGMCRMARVSHQEGLCILKEAGVEAIPGGGAEIFDPDIRSKICPDKADAQTWLSIHDTSHRLGISSNATMLFGHIETPQHQVAHLDLIRKQQDKSGGFTAFIPLKYRSAHNELSHLGEVDIIQTMRLFAVSRLFLDNIPHIKAYWPMLGKEATQMALLFGADDIDGTIQRSTKIYSMAGAEEQRPDFTKEELVSFIKSADYQAIERDSFYRVVCEY